MTDLHHAGKLITAMALLRRDASHCDVLLQASETSWKAAVEKPSEELGVWAHRAVLAAASPYFFAMFNSSFEQCSMQVVVIRDVELETLRALVENIYLPRSLSVTVEKAKALLAAATKLDVGDVRDAACDCLTRALNTNNVLGIRASADQYNCTALTATATQYIREHFEQVLQTRELLNLAPETLATLLESDREPGIEEQVLDAVLRWTQHRPQERRRHIEPLLRAVRLILVPRQALVHRAQTNPVISTEPRALIQVIDALAQTPSALLVMGGGIQDSASNSTWLCPLPSGQWQSLAAMPEPRASAGAALLNGRVYVVGGRGIGYYSSAVCTVFMFDPATNSWSSGPPLSSARRWPSVAALGGRLYAAGGWNDNNAWIKWIIPNNTPHTVEALDPREGVWRPVADMSTYRRGHGLAVLQGKLYAVGGHDGSNPLCSTERYDPTAGKWEATESMTERRDALRVSTVDNILYAVAGHDGTKVLSTVEQYRVGSGWEPAPPLTVPRSGVAVASYGGRLYAAGGFDGKKYITDTSVLHPDVNSWSAMPALPAGYWAPTAVVVPWRPSDSQI